MREKNHSLNLSNLGSDHLQILTSSWRYWVERVKTEEKNMMKRTNQLKIRPTLAHEVVLALTWENDYCLAYLYLHFLALKDH